jgi:signal transduction histidine kinase
MTAAIPEPLIAWADPNHVRLVLRNLINNALKFTPQGGSIKIQGFLQKAQVIVNVIDTGIGMNEEQLGKLFKTNQHFTTSGTGGEKGTGLGLLLCQEVVTKNGGAIWASSEQGKGSVFSFSLPLK